MKCPPDQPIETPEVRRAIDWAEQALKSRLAEGKLSRQPGRLHDRTTLAWLCLRDASDSAGRNSECDVIVHKISPLFTAGDERRAMWRLPVPTRVEYDDELALPVIQLARQGDVAALDVLRAFARKFIEEGKPLPPHLGSHVVEVYSDLLHTKPRSRSKLLEQRDYEIAIVIATVVKMGFAPTARRLPKRRQTASACWIVATAIARLRQNVSLVAVEKIWNRHKDWMPRYLRSCGEHLHRMDEISEMLLAPLRVRLDHHH